jgi:spermidine synthase
VDNIKEPLKLIKFYGILELVIGAYGLVLPLLLVLFKPLYAFVYNHIFSYFFAYTLLTFIGCLLLLIIPVICMGATLPLLSRFFITTISRVGTHVGRLYGINTIGAAIGSLVCGFWLIDALGVWGSLSFAIGLNFIIGMVCILTERVISRKQNIPDEVSAKGLISREKSSPVSEKTSPEIKWALLIFAVSGFSAMAYEVIWTKLLGLIVGPTTYSFTIVLVTFITCLALGSLFFGRLGDRVKNIFFLLLATQLGAALFALFFSQVMGESQIYFAKLISTFKDHFALLSLFKFLSLFLFMFLPTFCLGATFPLVGKIYTNSLSHTGRSIGSAYAINSIGSVLGAFCAGFVLIPFLGKEHGLSLVVALQLLVAVVAGIVVFRKSKEALLKWIPFSLAAVLGLIMVFNYPHWDRKMLSIGKYHRFANADIDAIGWFESLVSGTALYSDRAGGEIVYFGDGIGGFTTVLKSDRDLLGNEAYSLYNSGKPDASSKLDMDTQTLSAHLPLLFHKNPENVLVIGLASGITAGEILHYPVKQLDIAEINNQVVDASDFFIPWNSNVLKDPRTQLIIQDGRAHLALTKRRYDVISSEPSNPWMAGLAALFTREFFEHAKSKLNRDGIFVQFIHTYQMDWETFALVGRTFADVFPNSYIVRTNPLRLGPDFLMVGINGNGGLDEETARKNLVYAQRSENISMHNHRILYYLVVSEDLQGFFGQGRLNTDARPYLEFSAPKLLHYSDATITEKIIRKRRIGQKIAGIVKKDATNVDAQLDYSEYALKFIRPGQVVFNPVDSSMATTAQRQRFMGLIKDYCTNEIVNDFSFAAGDDELKRICVSAQLAEVKRKFETATEKVPYYFHLGVLYAANEMPAEAYNYFSESMNSDPQNVDASFNMGVLLAQQGRKAEAIKHYLKILETHPHNMNVLNNLAWIYSTDKDPNVRDGKRAVFLLEQALKQGSIPGMDKDPNILDTLAAAYAEAREFAKARKTVEKVIGMARSRNDEMLVKEMQQRLQLYRAGLPLRE